LPLARTEVAGAASHGYILVAGGMTANGAASARADLYEPERNAWVRMPDLPVALHHAALADFNHRLYLIGGYTADGAASAAVWSFGLGEHAWRTEAPLPRPRAALAASRVGDVIVVAGGVVDGQATNTTAVFGVGTGWRDGPLLARAREHLAATIAGGRVFVIGGRAGGQNFRDVESWDGVDASGWRVEPSLQHSRGGIGAASIAGRPCVAGGEEPAGTIGSVECLAGDRWRGVATLATPRHGVAVVALDRALHVIGGGRRPGLSVSATHEVLAL
jgi:hypothetical protein